MRPGGHFFSAATSDEPEHKRPKMATHQSAPASTDCLICYDELSAENYVEFRTSALVSKETQHVHDPVDAWVPAKACQSCLEVGPWPVSNDRETMPS